MIADLARGQDPSLGEADGEPAPSSASKALALLEAIAQSPSGLFGVTDVAAQIGVPKSTAHRLLKTFEGRGFVSRAGSKYRVGSRYFQVLEAARWSQFGELRDAAYQPLAVLFESSGAVAVHLAVLNGGDVFYLEKITNGVGTRLPSRVGGRFPASCTALGKSILAFRERSAVAQQLREPLVRATPYSVSAYRRFLDQLDEARSIGFAVEREEACQGTACVAAPVLRDGQAIAAISISVSTSGLTSRDSERLSRQGAQATRAAAAVARLLSDSDAPR